MSEYPQKFHKVQKADFILHVAINRPKLLNAMDKPTYLEFGQIFQIAAEDRDVRAVVLSGEGRGFCAGLDVAGSAADLGKRDDEDDETRVAIKRGKNLREFQAALGFPHVMYKPVIAVIQGACVGLGIDIISGVDIRYAVEDAKFSVKEIELGMAADIGTLQRLPKIVGNYGWVKDVCYTGRTFGPAEALSQGLVNQVFKTKDEALASAFAYAKDIAEKSPVAIQGTKRALNFAIDHTVQEGLDQIAEYNSYALGQDFMDGAMAMMQSIQTRKKVVPKYSRL